MELNEKNATSEAEKGFSYQQSITADDSALVLDTIIKDRCRIGRFMRDVLKVNQKRGRL